MRDNCFSQDKDYKNHLPPHSHTSLLSSARHRKCFPTVSRGPRKMIKQQLLSHTYSVCDTGSSDQTGTHTLHFFSRVRGTGGAALQLVEGHEKLSNRNYCLTRKVCVTLVRPIKRAFTHSLLLSSARHRRCCPTVSRGPRKIIK